MADDALCPDCQHPWAAHEDRGCTVWRIGEGPCTCRRTGPGDEAAAGDAPVVRRWYESVAESAFDMPAMETT
jgi:hypothetical protein